MSGFDKIGRQAAVAKTQKALVNSKETKHFAFPNNNNKSKFNDFKKGAGAGNNRVATKQNMNRGNR